MRYLAQFSEAPRTGTPSFWRDAAATEAWLFNQGKRVHNRRLVMRARSTRTLEPWLKFQTQPLAIDAWLDPMETTVTWNYLIRFLAEMGPERIWVPCGDDSWVGWTRNRLTIRAARESWLWSLAEDIWDPAGWSDRSELEWWADSRLQHAVKLPWGISEQRSWPTGWEEWTLDASADSLTPLWLTLADRLGTRPLRVKWLQESAPPSESLLGLKARYISCDLTSSSQGAQSIKRSQWLDDLSHSPEPLHVRTQAVWSIPEWSPDWATVMTLRRVQRGTRLETTYSPREPMGRAPWQSLQRERRQIPILQIRPLVMATGPNDNWERLEREASSYRVQEELTAYLQSAEWPISNPAAQARTRLAPDWSIKRWASQPGLWVLGYKDVLEVHVEWPTAAHPGNIGVGVVGAAPISMNEWVRGSRFKRLNRDRRYWARWTTSALMPMLERFLQQSTAMLGPQSIQ